MINFKHSLELGTLSRLLHFPSASSEPLSQLPPEAALLLHQSGPPISCSVVLQAVGDYVSSRFVQLDAPSQTVDLYDGPCGRCHSWNATSLLGGETPS